MKLSIIVPVYNVEYYLSACMTSIFPVLEPTDEIFLVQGKSTDQSRSYRFGIKKSIPRSRCWTRTEKAYPMPAIAA